MNILVLNPPALDNNYINRDQMGGMGQHINFGKDFFAKLLSDFKSHFIRIPVTQLVYAATIASEEHNVKVIDAINEGKNVELTLREISLFSPDFVVMPVSSSGLNFEKNVIAGGIKLMLPDCKIITVGDTLPYLPQHITQPIDICISGEVENCLLDICANKDLKEIKGISYVKDGKTVTNVSAPFLQALELDKVPFPKWELFPYTKYKYYPLILKAPVATLLSTRGCPYGCHYCSYTENQGLKWRTRSAENVVEELALDYEKYGFKGVFFRDPLFTLDKKRTSDICNGLIERGIDLSFALETRPELLSEELIDKLKQAGCTAINMGVEDINVEVLRQVRIPVKTEIIEKTVNYAEKAGIRTTCFFILGLPGSTRETIQKTIDFSINLNPSHAEYKIATPYPGTKLYKQAKEKKWIIEENYDKLGGYSSVMQINDKLSPEYLEEQSSNAFKRFYYRPSYLFKELRRGKLLSKASLLLKTGVEIIREKNSNQIALQEQTTHKSPKSSLQFLK
ncbi:radical SAM protein [Candidatus Woesearchaeota archaeon]|nr:radical SAM protein [Candidatus Woesearchaeota archaeon]